MEQPQQAYPDYIIQIEAAEGQGSYTASVYRKTGGAPGKKTFTSYPCNSKQEAERAALEYLSYLRKPAALRS